MAHFPSIIPVGVLVRGEKKWFQQTVKIPTCCAYKSMPCTLSPRYENMLDAIGIRLVTLSRTGAPWARLRQRRTSSTAGRMHPFNGEWLCNMYSTIMRTEMLTRRNGDIERHRHINDNVIFFIVRLLMDCSSPRSRENLWMCASQSAID